MHSTEWDDLRVLLAVVDRGSLAAAARALGVNHTTVLRRIAAAEDRLGVRLFDRLPGGYAPTTAAEELVAVAREVGELVTGAERRVAGRDLALSGAVRLTTSDTLFQTVLPPHVASFAARHPEVALEITTTTAMANLTKRDADVAVRPSTEPPPNLVGRRVAAIAYAIYGAPSYLDVQPARRELARHAWVAPDDSLASTTVARWMARALADVRVALRADTFTAIASAAAAGLGLAALPCFVGDAHPGLARVRGLVPELATELWVLTHEDLRHTARIRALTDHLVEALTRDRPRLEGKMRQRAHGRRDDAVHRSAVMFTPGGPFERF